jgi:hypothetical protein
MNYLDWREPKTKAFSCEYKPADYSCDNGVLFTAEACLLGLISQIDLIGVCLPYSEPLGVFKRHPSSPDLCSWDDHYGASIASPYLANCVLSYMDRNSWELPNGNWIGRIPILKPAVRAGAGRSLSWWDQLVVAAVYFHNSFEKREETSGKMMLFFGRSVFQRHWLTRKAIGYWNGKMAKLYGTPRGMIAIYFPDKQGNTHPFVTAAPDSF